MYGNRQRGESRDYVPTRERVEPGEGASMKDGVSMRKTASQPRPHYRKRTGKERRDAGLDGLMFIGGL